MINVKKINFSYKKGHPLFKNLSLNVSKGNIHCILGKNGVGKTTLLHSILGLCNPLASDIYVDGKSNLCAESKKKIFFIPEDPFTPKVTIREYADAIKILYKNFDNATLENLLGNFELDSKLKLDEISYGQKKKALISIAISTNSPILIFDEPTNGLDIDSKAMFRKVIANYMSKEKTVLLSTHQMRDMEEIIDNIIVLNNGKIIFNESIESISKKLFFSNVELNYSDENIIYSQNGSLSKQIISKNTNNDISSINLEFLYQAIIECNYSINKAFES